MIASLLLIVFISLSYCLNDVNKGGNALNFVKPSFKEDPSLNDLLEHYHPQLIELHQSMETTFGVSSRHLSRLHARVEPFLSSAPGVLLHFAFVQGIMLIYNVYQEYNKMKAHTELIRFMVGDIHCENMLVLQQSVHLLKAMTALRQTILQLSGFDDINKCKSDFQRTCSNINEKTLSIPHSNEKSTEFQPVENPGNSFKELLRRLENVEKSQENANYDILMDKHFKVVNQGMLRALEQSTLFSTLCAPDAKGDDFTQSCMKLNALLQKLDSQIELFAIHTKRHIETSCQFTDASDTNLMHLGSIRERAYMDITRTSEWNFAKAKFISESRRLDKAVEAGLQIVAHKDLVSHEIPSISKQGYNTQLLVPDVHRLADDYHLQAISSVLASMVYYAKIIVANVVPTNLQAHIGKSYAEAVEAVCSETLSQLRVIASVQKMFLFQEEMFLIVQRIDLNGRDIPQSVRRSVMEIFDRFQGDEGFMGIGHEIFCRLQISKHNGIRDPRFEDECNQAVSIAVTLMDPHVSEYERQKVFFTEKDSRIHYIDIVIRLFKRKSHYLITNLLEAMENLGCDRMRYLHQFNFEKHLDSSSAFHELNTSPEKGLNINLQSKSRDTEDQQLSSRESARSYKGYDLIPEIGRDDYSDLSPSPNPMTERETFPLCKVETIVYCVASVQKELCQKSPKPLQSMVSSVFTKYFTYYPPHESFMHMKMQEIAQQLAEQSAGIASQVESSLQSIGSSDNAIPPEYASRVKAYAFNEYLRKNTQTQPSVHSYYESVLVPLAKGCGNLIHSLPTSQMSQSDPLRCSKPMEAAKHFESMQFDISAGMLTRYYALLVGGGVNRTFTSASCDVNWETFFDSIDGYDLLQILFPSEKPQFREGDTLDSSWAVYRRQRFCDWYFDMEVPLMGNILAAGKTTCNNKVSVELTDDVKFCKVIANEMLMTDDIIARKIQCLGKLAAFDKRSISQDQLTRRKEFMSKMYGEKANEPLCEGILTAMQTHKDDKVFCNFLSLQIHGDDRVIKQCIDDLSARDIEMRPLN